jgi:hypothetical protein
MVAADRLCGFAGFALIGLKIHAQSLNDWRNARANGVVQSV